jgi:hypothetical protein
MPPQATADPLSRALDEAVAGRRQPLYELLTRGSRLPGTRANDALAEAFAQACRARGAKADALVLAMAGLSADEAPGATALEFLPVCAVTALGTRAAADPAMRGRFVGELHAHADDLRFRVRDAVIAALARVGGAAGEALAFDVDSWMDGYFHAAAVLSALGNDVWLTQLHAPDAVVARLDDAFALARDAPRSAARYPGRKALVDALRTVPTLAAARFGVSVFDMLERWAAAADPELRAVVEENLASRKLGSRFGQEIDRVRRALAASAPPVRNPDHDVGPTRDRSGARRKKGR